MALCGGLHAFNLLLPFTLQEIRGMRPTSSDQKAAEAEACMFSLEYPGALTVPLRAAAEAFIHGI